MVSLITYSLAIPMQLIFSSLDLQFFNIPENYRYNIQTTYYITPKNLLLHLHAVSLCFKRKSTHCMLIGTYFNYFYLILHLIYF